MKILFLDIDGVMNNAITAPESCRTRRWDDYPVTLLRFILNVTGAQVVISSSWRKTVSIQEFRQLFTDHSLPSERIIGYTAELGRNEPHKRGLEIEQWLNDHGHRGAAFAILDDGNDMGPVNTRFVQTDGMQGMSLLNAVRVIQLLEDITW